MLPSVLLAFFPAAAEEVRVDGHDGGWWEGTAALGQQGPALRASARRWAGLRGRRRREEKPRILYTEEATFARPNSACPLQDAASADPGLA